MNPCDLERFARADDWLVITILQQAAVRAVWGTLTAEDPKFAMDQEKHEAMARARGHSAHEEHDDSEPVHFLSPELLAIRECTHDEHQNDDEDQRQGAGLDDAGDCTQGAKALSDDRASVTEAANLRQNETNPSGGMDSIVDLAIVDTRRNNELIAQLNTRESQS